MRGSIIIISLMAGIGLPACANKAVSAQQFCNAVSSGDLGQVSHQINQYIRSHQKIHGDAVLRYTTVTNWLQTHPCVSDVIPPEAIHDIYPASYSIYINFNTGAGERIVKLDLQQDTQLKFLSLTNAPNGFEQFRQFSAELIKSVFVSKDNLQSLAPFYFSSHDYLNFYKEQLSNASTRKLFLQLDSSYNPLRYLQVISELKDAHALYHLLALLQHSSYDIKIAAITALIEMKDKRAQPLLLHAARQNAVDVPGSEHATLHKIFQQKLIESLDVITENKTNYSKGNETEALKRGLMIWTKKQ